MINLRQNEAFQQISPEKQEMIERLAANLEGKQLSQAMPILTDWKRQMQEKNLTLTPAEDKIITDILFGQLTPSQKKQFDMLTRLMKTKKF
jgi:hypothetical protein